MGESDIDSIEEICVTPEQIKKRMDAVQRTLGNLAQQITTLQGQVAASAGLQWDRAAPKAFVVIWKYSIQPFRRKRDDRFSYCQRNYIDT